MTSLNGKTALITGSASGIGLGIALELARAGARIALHSLPGDAGADDAVKAVLDAGAPEAKFFGADVSKAQNVRDLMAEVEGWGPVDILVNNAGIQHTAPIEDMPDEKWDAIIAIMLSACFHTMKAALPKMAERGYGRVVNIASVHGLVASKEKSPYVAAKHGLVGMSKVVALEYASKGDPAKGGVTVNCIGPGFTETALIESQIQAKATEHGGDRDAGIADLLSEKQPSLRMTQTSDLGALALFLCSDAAHNITGVTVPVDGGWTAQ
ncbi:3-hydroxybutyrate dehydrogenase [Maritimibacter sp. UBA3975]|uniref:3-hydroxybutyrate dehydrogenase n=1 Tax=Maritimibacter sp. UBA3975 TaxID=1946833 RepID=UPI000C0B9266|nr:3-hydroxybutyrate dehydrogenase [Maritimibacter sp. UBA3975]MAM61503.1 3-hydroxybutyrate dehydrogenase [Maritimibacter sp.]|tara:strand:- start:23714 stop:24517 length:804 start_codon:yes stop_codon:yes gene_type:complete